MAENELAQENSESKEDFLKKAVTYDNINELPFLSMVMNEALRMEPPVGTGSP